MLDDAIQIGELVAGKYRVQRILGSGGMGVVAAAQHEALDRTVAIKFLRLEALQSPQAKSRFLREAKFVANLESPYIARVLDTGETEAGFPYIAMEYLEGQDLDQLLEASGPLSVAATVELAMQVCEGLAVAHAKDLVHRDLKPANLYVTQAPTGERVIKILDFGIAKPMQESAFARSANETETRGIVGTPSYMSPEQLRTPRDIDIRTDIWALGAIIYQSLTCRLPFEAESLGDIMMKICMEPHQPLTHVLSGADRGLGDIVDRCLSKDRDERYASVLEVAEDLVRLAEPSQAGVPRRIAHLLGVARASVVSVASASAAQTSAPLRLEPHHPQSTQQVWGSQTLDVPMRRSRGWLYALVAVPVLAVGVWLAVRSTGAETSAPPSESPAAPAALPSVAEPAEPSVVPAEDAEAVRSRGDGTPSGAPSAELKPAAAAPAAKAPRAEPATQPGVATKSPEPEVAAKPAKPDAPKTAPSAPQKTPQGNTPPASTLPYDPY